MKTKSTFFPLALIALILIVGCSKDNPPPDPGISTLIAPLNDEACLDGRSLNDTQSSVSFQWTSATDALSYQVKVTNLATNTEELFSSTTNNLDITLVKEEPYKWQVISLGEEGTNPGESETWKFYLSGNPQINYAPFPAELITPRSGATITPSAGQITASWNCSDVDGDLVSYQVYLDTTDGSTMVQEVNHQSSTTQVQLDVAANQVYYWKVVATDANGNKSSSGVYSFRTQ